MLCEDMDITMISIVFFSLAQMVVHDTTTVPNSELKVKNGKKTYVWKEHGLSLELPLETGASFDLKIVSSQDFKFPEETELLSPVYLMETKGKLRGPVGLELQHCAQVKEDSHQLGMRFAVSKIEAWRPGKFVLCEGQFSNASHGKLEIEFPNWLAAVVRLKGAPGPTSVFLANLYFQQLSPAMCLIHFIIVPNQEAWEKVH